MIFQIGKACALLVAVLAGPGSGPERQGALEQAKKLVRQGMAAYGAGRHSEAAEAMAGAERLVRKSLAAASGERRHKLLRALKNIWFNLSLIYYKLGDTVRSVQYLRLYLARASAQERSDVPNHIMAQLGKVGVLTVRMPDPKAEIWVNGAMKARGKLELVVEPGPVEVVVRLHGKVVARRKLVVAPGTMPIWELAAFGPRPVARGATVAPGGPGAPPRVTKRKRGLGRLHWAYFAAATAVAVAAGAAVAGLGIKVLRLKDEFDSETDEARRNELKDEGDTYRTATNAMIGVLAAAAVTAGVLAVFTRWKGSAEERATTWNFQVAPEGKGLRAVFGASLRF